VHSPDGQAIGALWVGERQPRRFDAEAAQSLCDLARLIENELLVRSLAVRDRQTGLYNSEGFRHFADRAWRQARSAGLNASMIIVSLDSLEHGDHNGAERQALLRRISECIRRSCGGTGHILGHNRHDRFSLLVLDEDRNTIRVLAESIRSSLKNVGLPLPGSGPERLAVSVGASNSARVDYSMTDLVERAHAALRLARESGGQSVVLI
jgi:diguanylate cyclase (GGDEF)-like protein